MWIRFSCSCGASLQAAEEEAGDLTACPKCKAQVRVPLANEAIPSPLEDQPQLSRIEEEQAGTDSYSLFHPDGDPDDADFFVPAPDEIGPLRSAHTSLLKKTQPKPIWRRLLIGALVGSGVSALGALGLFFGVHLDPTACAVLFILFFLVITPFALILAWYFTRFSHYNGYVGEQGIAYFTCKGSRQNVKVRETFLFVTNYDLRVQKTHHFQKGVYSGTTYRYSWNNDAGTAVYVLAGQHNSHLRLPPLQDKYRFALAAEEGWSAYLLAAILPRIEAGETYLFRLQKRNSITVSKDFLELEINKKVQRLTSNQISEVKVANDKVALKEEGAREGWFHSEGVHSFSFSDLGNARVFLSLMEQEFGIPVTD
jgi:hypothetical protein